MRLINSLPFIEQLQLWDKKAEQYIQFKLWPRQKELHEVILSHRFIILLKKRQVGATQLVCADSLIQCKYQENFTTLLLSKTGDDATVALARVRPMHLSLPEEVRGINPIIKGEETGEELHFTSGSSFVSLPAIKGRGRTANRVIIDEGAFIVPRISHTTLEDVLMAVVPTVEKAEGQIIIISTANGMGKYQEMFAKAMAGKSNYKPFFFDCYSDPTFTPEKRVQIVKDYGEDHANSEYPRTWQEAFLSSGRPRFDRKVLQEYENNKLIPIVRGEITDKGVEKNDRGAMLFFQKKIDNGQYAVFADVAEGLEGGDYSCAKVFNIANWEQIAEWHGHVEHAEFGSVLARIGRHYNNAQICPEANNHGAATIIQLRNVEKYPEKLIFESSFMKLRPDDDYKNPEKRFGWYTTTRTKKIIIDNLAQMLNKKEIAGLSEQDIGELFTYIIENNGSTNAEQNCNDDRVMTLAIACYVLRFLKYRETKQWEICLGCQHYDEEVKTCKKTGRICKSSSYCILFTDIQRQWKSEETKGRKHRGGYRPIIRSEK